MTPDQTKRHIERLYTTIRKIRPDKNQNYKWNDQGLSALFGALHANYCRYNQTAKEWYVYNGKVWEIDNGGIRAAEYVKSFITAMRMYAATIDDEQRSEYEKFLKSYGQYTNRDHILKDARSVNHIVMEDFDRNLDLFNCQNGTLNLRTGTFTKHNPTDLLAHISNVRYDPDASSNDFIKFVNEIMENDEGKIKYLQTILGYALTADPNLEACFILYGESTRNGKGTLCETINYMMGGTKGYAMTAQPETIAQKEHKDSSRPSEDLARLNGCRFLNISEPPRRMLIDAALLKQMLGRDTITARFLHQNSFEYRPQFKLFINTNHLPVIADDTLFTSDRIIVIPFTRHFEANERDGKLKSRLQSVRNISGIFNWCYEGMKRYVSEGAKQPESILDAIEEYRASCDKIGRFLTDTFDKDENGRMKAGDAHKLYQVWCRDAGYGAESKGNFFEDLKKRGLFEASGTVNSRTERNVLKGYKKRDFSTDSDGNV